MCPPTLSLFPYTTLFRSQSDRFVSLDGIWKIRAYQKIQDVDLNDVPDREISVPSCVQLHGYDQIQYINSRYPFPFEPDRKSTRLNSSHVSISYAVFCLIK